MVTIKDVAKLANVSVATVSAVINKDSGIKVSDKLTKKVEEAIDELNYVPNHIARSLSRKENYTLGYIVPSITNEFFPQLAKAVEDI
ncbi:MAG: LacI family DNA-binding transcriptional regulator, partial [Halanaerobiaceae bacterium]